jgi:hypothetical protein
MKLQLAPNFFIPRSACYFYFSPLRGSRECIAQRKQSHIFYVTYPPLKGARARHEKCSAKCADGVEEK